MKRIIMLLFVALLCLSCSRKEDVIKIGVSLPLTGDAAIWGVSQKDGYELAISKINSKGGVSGKRVELIYGDDKGLASEGVKVLRKFIDIDKINIITGVANSSVALAYIPIINENKILFVSSGASSPKLTGSSKYFFRTWPSDIAEAIAMAKYAFSEQKLKNLFVLYMNNDYGIGLSKPFSVEWTNLGGKIVGNESFEQSASDYKVQLSKIKNANPDAIYLAGNPREMGRAIKQARELGIKKPFLSISTLNDPEVFSITGAKAIEGTIITDASFDPTSERIETQSFMNNFKAKYNKEPGILANTAYDALMIICICLEKVGNDSYKLQNLLHTMKSYEGVSGEISFSSGGDVNRPIRIARCENGKFISIIKNYRWF